MLRRAFLSTPLLLAQDVIRVDVNLVNVPFTVQDGRGQFLTGLTRDDFTVTEDGIPQRISFFSSSGNSPLSLAIVADVSGSQEDFVRSHRRDLRDFLETVLTPKDRAMLVCFGNYVRLASPLDAAADRLDEALREYQRGKNLDRFPTLGPPERRSGGSAFHDAIVHTASALAAEPGRRALIVLSDGEDNSSAHHLLDSIEAVQSAGATVFCLRYTDVGRQGWNARNKYGRGVMERLARESGGIDFDASGGGSLTGQFQHISAMLRASYDLAYASNLPPDGAFRKIRINCRQDDARLRHKTGYFARRPD